MSLEYMYLSKLPTSEGSSLKKKKRKFKPGLVAAASVKSLLFLLLPLPFLRQPLTSCCHDNLHHRPHHPHRHRHGYETVRCHDSHFLGCEIKRVKTKRGAASGITSPFETSICRDTCAINEIT